MSPHSDYSIPEKDYIVDHEGNIFISLGPVLGVDDIATLLVYTKRGTSELEKRLERRNGYFKPLEMQWDQDAGGDMTDASYGRYDSFMERHFPEYYQVSPFAGPVCILKRSEIDRIVSPREVLPDVMERDESIRLVYDKIMDETGIPIDHLGIIGSYLFDIENNGNDVDVVVYGQDSAEKVIPLIQRQLEQKGTKFFDWYGRDVSFHFAPLPSEQTFLKKVQDYELRGDADIDSKVAERIHPMFMPSVYGIAQGSKVISYHIRDRLRYLPGDSIRREGLTQALLTMEDEASTTAYFLQSGNFDRRHQIS